MKEETKKIFRIVGLVLVAVGAVMAFLAGASEASITGIVAGVIVLAIGIIAFVKSLLK